MLLRVVCIRRVTERVIFSLCSSFVLFGCGDDATDDDEIGESSSESTSESDSDGSTETESSSTDSTETTGETDSGSTETDVTETETDATETETETDATETDETDATETGDPSCEDDSYIGVALAKDDWGPGDLCDEIWVCADEDQATLIQAAVPNAMCTPSPDCPGLHCTLSFQVLVDEAVFEDVCDALSIPGIDEAYCIVFGP